MRLFLAVLLSCIPFTLSACTSFSSPPSSTSTALPSPTPIAEPFFEGTVALEPYKGSLTSAQLIESIQNPTWNTIWLRGHYLDGQTGIGYYLTAWLARSGQGVVSVSHEVAGKTGETIPDGLVTAYTILTDGSRVFRTDINQFSRVGADWVFHPLEQTNSFLSLFFPKELVYGNDFAIKGTTILAGEEVIALASEDTTLWATVHGGILLGVETGIFKDQTNPLRSMRVIDIEYDVPLPYQVNQPVPTGDDRPGLYDRPAPEDFDLGSASLQFDWVSDNVNNPLAGSSMDIYQGHNFIGSIRLGSAGFYCDRAPDGNHFAFLYSPNGMESQLKWVDLREISNIHSFSDLEGIGAPSWSPDSSKLLFSAEAEDLGGGERKLYLLDTVSDQIVELGGGSLVPPAWSDDGKYIYSLDSRYSELLVWDGVSLENVCTADFDRQNWTVAEKVCPVNNQDVANKLPRNSYVYQQKCTSP